MLQYSFSTMLMAVLSSNMIILFTAVCFCHRDILVSIGYKMFALLLGIAFLRFVFPFQLPFATNIVLPKPLSRVVLYFRHTFFMAGPFRVSMWGFFVLIWAVGVLVKLSVYVGREVNFYRSVSQRGRDITHEGYYARLLDEICGGRPNPFRVIEAQGLDTPMLYGIRRPRILVPAGMEIPQDILGYLLSHETAHHFHHDILIKVGLSLLETMYWWNPACYLLKAQLDAVLEMRVDNFVAGDTFDSKFGYLNCLVYVAEQSAGGGKGKVRVPGSHASLFSSHVFNNLPNRFDMISGEPKPYAKPLHIAALTVTVALYLFSYLFIFEARYAVPEENTFESSVSGIYAVLAGDGNYDVYYGNLLLETADSLEYYNGDMPVYDSLDEVPEELRIVFEQ